MLVKHFMTGPGPRPPGDSLQFLSLRYRRRLLSQSSLVPLSSSKFWSFWAFGSQVRSVLAEINPRSIFQAPNRYLNLLPSGEEGNESSMASATVDASGNPIPTSALLMASSKHVAATCRTENLAFINCKKKDPNPERCLDKGQQVTSCVLHLWVFRDLTLISFQSIGCRQSIWYHFFWVAQGIC